MMRPRNVWEWLEDCYHENYNGAPADGSAWISGNCSNRVVRGGSWIDSPNILRSAYRFGYATDYRIFVLGFRLGRTLLTPGIFVTLSLGGLGAKSPTFLLRGCHE
jgi:Sulfatase-modifying factor enzyme 1